jgi:poly-gamma-glutamate capsule biosynthesis protein CapA/YwtB (metallophosphatase superfamily)
MARVPARALAARNPLARQGRGHSGRPARPAIAFLVGLLLLATGSCSVHRASGSPASAATRAPASGASPGSAAPAPTTAAPGPASFTMVASGDVLPHSSLVARARAYGSSTGRTYDFRPMLRPIKPIVSRADLAVCHIETPLSPTGRNLSGYPTFNGPLEIATALRDAGYDACSTASNHSLDQGAQGISGTLQVLDRAGLRHAGIARNPRETQPTMLTVKGARVAMLSYAYGFNGRKVPAAQPWRANQIDPARILADARAARRAGSQFTVVFLHWGQEYQTAPTPQQLSVARRLLADPSIDLILGHHVHVVQPARRIGGKWVAFGMGNLLSAQSASCCPASTQDGVIMHVKVVRSGNRYVVGQLNYIPTWVQHPSFRVLPVLQSLAHGGLDAGTRSALTVSQRRTRTAMGPQVRPLAS